MGKKRRSRRRGRGRADRSAAPLPKAGGPGAAGRAGGGGEAGKRPFPRLPLFAAAVVVLAAVALFVILRPGGRSRVQRDGRLNVLLITMDTTRADRHGCYG